MALPYVRLGPAPKSLAPYGQPKPDEIAARVRGCTGKVGYRTVRAVKETNVPRWRREGDYAPRWVYRCKHCRLYHMTRERLPGEEYTEIRARPREE